jgi:flagellar biosynthetic protein FliR
MSTTYLLTWMFVFLRSVGVLTLMPTLAGRAIPVPVRLALSMLLSVMLAGLVPAAEIPEDLGALLHASVREVLLGFAMGFVVKMCFASVELAGRIISNEIGLSAQPGFGAPVPSSEPVAAFLTAFAVILFFLVGGHLTVLSAFARSFSLATAGQALLGSGAADYFILASSHVIEMGLRMAAPFIALNFLIILAFSVLGRAVPKMNIFIVSFSVRSLLGLGLLSGGGALIARYLMIEFSNLPFEILRIF